MTDILVPLAYNDRKNYWIAQCQYCEQTIYLVSDYVAEAIGRPLPESVPHTCVLPQLPADYGNPSHYDDGTPRYMN